MIPKAQSTLSWIGLALVAGVALALFAMAVVAASSWVFDQINEGRPDGMSIAAPAVLIQKGDV